MLNEKLVKNLRSIYNYLNQEVNESRKIVSVSNSCEHEKEVITN